MKIKDVSFIFLLVAILIHMMLPIDVHGQGGENLKFSKITTADGLSHHEVLFVTQDSQGFMWFGTKHGLNKYDGISFTPYFHDPEPENTDSLVGNFAHWIHQDQVGGLWIATWGAGISRYDQKADAFTNYSHQKNNPQSLASNNVWSIYVDSKGLVWASTDGGVSKFNPETKKFINYRHDPQNPDSLSNNTVSRIREDDQGIFWISTYGGGLNRFDPETETFTNYKHRNDDPKSLSNDNLWSVYIDSKKRIWIGSEMGLNRFDPETETFTRYRYDKTDPNSLSFDIVTVMFEDHAGMLWLGTFGGGLNRFDPVQENFVHFKHDAKDPHSLSNDIIMSIYEDTTGTLWVATYGGINKYDPGEHQFEHFHYVAENPNSLNNSKVRSIFQDRNGSVWIGTDGGGLNRFDRKDNSFTHYLHSDIDPTSISGNDIRSIDQDQHGDLWIGTHETGLNRLNPVRQTFTRYQHDSDNLNTPASNAIYDLVVDKKRDVLWIASYLSGLDKFDIEKQTFTHYRYDANNPDGIISNWSTAVFVDSNGLVWVGTEAGLSRFNPETNTFTNFQYDINDPESLSSNMIQVIFEDSRNIIWIGTGNGLNRYKEGTSFKRFSYKNGLAGNYVASIEEDNRSNLWISTNQGLSKFNPHDETFRNYNQQGGLQGNRFFMHSSAGNEAGELFFGGENGFNVFNPERLKDNEHIPKVAFTNFKLSNQQVQVGEDSPLKQQINHSQQIVLEYDQRVFSLGFVTLNYRYSKNNQYAYMLEGFEKHFNYVDSSHPHATYTNLDPGKYSFVVKGSNNDGVWNEEGKSINIVVIAPWWQTISFRCAMLILAIGLIYSTFRLRTYSIRQQNRRLEIQVAERTRELKAWLEHSPVCTKVIDLDFNLQYMSSACIKGLQIEDVMPYYGKPYPFEFYPESYKTATIENLKKVRDAGEVIKYEAPVVDIVGNELWYLTTMLPVKDDNGRIENIILISIDTTARKKSEKELQKHRDHLEKLVKTRTEDLEKTHKQLLHAEKLSAVGKLSASIAHEFNNPLQGVMNVIGRIRRKVSLPDSDAKLVDMAISECDRMKHLIKDLQNFNRPTTSVSEPTDIHSTIDSILVMGKKNLKVHGISLEKQYSKDIPLVKVVPDQLKQVALNLFNNAIDACDKGGEITITTEMSGENIVIYFHDNGNGIRPEDIDHIFEPFFTTKPAVKGTGLGLSVSYGIIKSHGGNIDVESEVGKGTTFTLTLPVDGVS